MTPEYEYKKRLDDLLDALPVDVVDNLISIACAPVDDDYETYLIDDKIGIRRVLWERLKTPRNEHDQFPMSLDDALTLAQQAKALVSLASDLLHQICTSRIYITPSERELYGLPEVIQSKAGEVERSVRHAGSEISFNYVGLLDTIEREMNKTPD